MQVYTHHRTRVPTHILTLQGNLAAMLASNFDKLSQHYSYEVVGKILRGRVYAAASGQADPTLPPKASAKHEGVTVNTYA